ncbi:MAG: co-chaperone GroES [Clostridiales bacterium]|jgi:chaperonin GroES|nr:co-chaperone GroES [Clostridiales bacterium]
MQLKPVLDKVVIKAIEAEETTKGGLILSSASQEKPQICEVIAVGPGGMIDGKETAMFVKKGQKVIAAKYAGTEIKLDDETYTIISQSDILAIVE